MCSSDLVGLGVAASATLGDALVNLKSGECCPVTSHRVCLRPLRSSMSVLAMGSSKRKLSRYVICRVLGVGFDGGSSPLNTSSEKRRGGYDGNLRWYVNNHK